MDIGRFVVKTSGVLAVLKDTDNDPCVFWQQKKHTELITSLISLF